MYHDDAVDMYHKVTVYVLSMQLYIQCTHTHTHMKKTPYTVHPWLSEPLCSRGCPNKGIVG